MINDQSIEIGKKLKAHLRKKGISQIELAEKLGVSAQFVYSVLKGRQLGRNAALKWGNILEINPNWFLTGEGEIDPQEDKNSMGNNSVTEKVYLEVIQNKDNQIIELAKIIGKLEAEIEFLKKS